MILSTAIGSARTRADLSDHVVKPVRRICCLRLTLRMSCFLLCVCYWREGLASVLHFDLLSQQDIVGINGELCGICVSQQLDSVHVTEAPYSGR